MSLLPLEEAEELAPVQPHLSAELDEIVRERIELRDQKRATKKSNRGHSQAGQPSPVGGLMQLAVKNPKAFWKLYIAVSLRPAARRRRKGSVQMRTMAAGGEMQ
jgi:hypothetical protein